MPWSLCSNINVPRTSPVNYQIRYTYKPRTDNDRIIQNVKRFKNMSNSNPSSSQNDVCFLKCLYRRGLCGYPLTHLHSVFLHKITYKYLKPYNLKKQDFRFFGVPSYKKEKVNPKIFTFL